MNAEAPGRRGIFYEFKTFQSRYPDNYRDGRVFMNAEF